MANVTPSMRHGFFGTGVLGDSNPFAVSMADAPLPATVLLNSSAAGRKIEVSLDGATYFVPAYDSTLTGQIAVSLLSGVVNVRFTGQAGDQWGVL